MGYPEEMLSFTRHTNLCIHNSENYMFLELSLFSCTLVFVYQLIVRSSCAFVLSMSFILVVCQAILFGMTRRNKLQHLIHIQDWVKVVVFHRSKCQPSFCSVLPWSITPFMPGFSWELHQLLWILDAVILLAIIIHFSVSVLSQPECRQVNHGVWNQYS